jgi:hypothetical protein
MDFRDKSRKHVNDWMNEWMNKTAAVSYTEWWCVLVVLYNQQENTKFRKKYDGWIYRIKELRKQIRQTSNFTHNIRNTEYDKKKRDR